MTGRVKTLGLSLLLTFLLGATVTSSASAAGLKYVVKSSPVTAVGVNTVMLFEGEAVLKCAKLEVKFATPVGEPMHLTGVPKYRECQIRGNEAAVVVEKAEYEFGTPEEVLGKIVAPFSIIGSGAHIKITTETEGENCEITIGSQATPGNAITFTENLAKTGGQFVVDTKGVKYKTNNKCASIASKEGEGGTIEAQLTETGITV
jgi:hypothetical protein